MEVNRFSADKKVAESDEREKPRFRYQITGVKVGSANCALGPKYFDVPEIWAFACYQTPRQRVVQIFTTVSPSRISSGASPSLRRCYREGESIFFRIKIKLNEAPWREKNGPHEKSPSTSSRRKDITDVTLLLAGIVNLSAPLFRREVLRDTNWLLSRRGRQFPPISLYVIGHDIYFCIAKRV